MKALYERLAALSPETRQYIIGAGSALNMMPFEVTRTFHTSDIEALRSDWQKVADGLWGAIDRAEREKGIAEGK